MRLELDSLDSTGPKGRAKAALRQLEEERSTVVMLLEREIDGLRGQLDRIDSVLANERTAAGMLLGSLGPQVNADKVNAIGGRLHQVDEMIQLWQDVIGRSA